MKNIIRIYFLALSCLFLCKKNGDSTIISVAKTKVDTIITNSTTILVAPNENEIEEIKKKQGEDNFYTIADDANYYISEIINESKGGIHKTQQQKISFSKEHFIYNKNEADGQWQILEYKIGNKPKIYSLVSYYSRISTIDKKINDTDNIDTLYEPNESLFFDNDNINDDVKILAKPNNEMLNFELSFHLSTFNKTIKAPVLNNSILYNNDYSVYYVSDPIIKGKIVELRVEYADQTTKPDISGDKKNIIEKIKFRFNDKSKKVQIIGYDLSYKKQNKSSYSKSFNFITGKFYCSINLNGEKKETSGQALELQNVYIEKWKPDFLNKLLLYGNEIQ